MSSFWKVDSQKRGIQQRKSRLNMESADETIQRLRLLKLLLEIQIRISKCNRCLVENVENVERNRYKFSNRNRSKFQRKLKMSQKATSPNLLSQEDGSSTPGGSVKLSCQFCNKDYVKMGALKNHEKICGKQKKEEESFLIAENPPSASGKKQVMKIDQASTSGEDGFEPTATSTTENFLEVMKGELGEDKLRNLKRKREKNDVGHPEREEEENDERGKPKEEPAEENLEDAKRARALRTAELDQLAIERELNMGFDLDETMVGEEESTQQIVGNLRKAIEGKEQVVFDEPSQQSQAPQQGSGGGDKSEDESEDEDMKVMNHNMKVMETLVAEKDTKIMDLKVKLQECNDMIDERDKIIRENKKLINFKNEEIQELVAKARNEAEKMKASPLKEVLKTEGEKARKKILELQNENKTLNTRLKKFEGSVSELEKMKRVVSEHLERADGFKMEEKNLLNKISYLRRQIPCKDVATCDKGNKCQYSHTLKYDTGASKDTSNIPCEHYIRNKCTRENCGYSHDLNKFSQKQLQMRQKNMSRRNNNEEYFEDEEELPEYEDTFQQGSSRGPRYSNMAKHSYKRQKLVDYDTTNSTYDTDDTRNFPEPVPAVAPRYRSYTHSPRSEEKDRRRFSGNGHGAQNSRPDLVTPERRRGSSQPRGRRGNSRGRGSPRPQERRWDRVSDLRREEAEDRQRRRW